MFGWISRVLFGGAVSHIDGAVELNEPLIPHGDSNSDMPEVERQETLPATTVRLATKPASYGALL
jgi:hypothetical protein